MDIWHILVLVLGEDLKNSSTHIEFLFNDFITVPNVKYIVYNGKQL